MLQFTGEWVQQPSHFSHVPLRGKLIFISTFSICITYLWMLKKSCPYLSLGIRNVSVVMIFFSLFTPIYLPGMRSKYNWIFEGEKKTKTFHVSNRTCKSNPSQILCKSNFQRCLKQAIENIKKTNNVKKHFLNWTL